MHKLEYSSQFKKDLKKVTKMSIPHVSEAGDVISSLQRGETLDARYVDHGLIGDRLEDRDCHVKPGLVLIYKIDLNVLKLAHIGSHSELFK